MDTTPVGDPLPNDSEMESLEEKSTSVDKIQDTPRSDASKRSLLEDLYRERATRKRLQSQVDTLTESVSMLESSQKDLEAVQSRYARLEAFLLGTDTELSRMLDSRSFTDKLFNTDDDIADVIKAWRKSHLSDTSHALENSSAAQSQRVSIGDLLHAASR